MSLSSTAHSDHSADAGARWWTRETDGRILCHLCPRACRLKPGDRGFCFVRVHRDDQMVLDTYGRSTGFCIDPIEKKPLNHFLPGTPVLSFGTAGCNLGCKFCQNWDISKSREVARLSDRAMPEDIAAAAAKTGCRSVAFTYNDPVIWAEYAIDTAAACRAQGIKSVAVTAGYITPEARGEFFDAMDAANIDLKAFTEDFYFKLTGAHLAPVLDTIRYVARETDCWVELTNLIIPQANDNEDEFRRMCDWILEAVGADVPIHFTAFHPDFRMRDRGPTPHETLLAAYEVAKQTGLRYVYVGNVHDVSRQSTYCPGCSAVLIERDWYQLGRYELHGNHCRHCGFQIAGRFEDSPGDWGPRRQPIRIAGRAPQLPIADSPGFSAKGNLMASAPVQNELADAFTKDELESIHRAACHYVSAVVQGQAFDLAAALGSLAQRPVAGIYVTLKRGETLRGCCGLQGPPMSLASALADSATRTAKHDPRMAPIAPLELPHLNLSVSILGPARPIGVTGDQRVEAVQIGQHGLRIRSGSHVGLLLPMVAIERSWNALQFLDAVCTKAGLPPGSWQRDDAEVEVFDGISFGGRMVFQEPTVVRDVSIFSIEQLHQLQSWVRLNLSAIQTGATPFYYASYAPDASVSGVVLNVTFDAQQPPVSWLQLNLREGIPLQSSLFQLTQTAARSLASAGPATNWRVDIAILSTVIHHGVDTDYELAGVNCQSRALMLMDGRSWAFGFDRSADAAQLYQQTHAAENFRSGATMVYSVVCEATCSTLSVSSGPRADSAIASRPPAVAGVFYPASDQAREAQVDALLAGLPVVERQTVAAAMVPHAGLRYSGRIAADVWRRIELPSRVLIIGPKHTPDGLEWAVAPHDEWRLSDTARMVGDVELAREIASAVTDMELDAAAHRTEHGIEVQLPLLYRLAPHTRVAAIAMSGASIDRLQHAAKQLARCLAAMDDPPLLVISSDMNHFADDAENRRRDRLALDVLSKREPEELLRICAAENISMCGQVPAALVLMTLRELGRETRYTEVAYGTSGDISGDRSRVVGYAGVLF
jgi:AmmeMemoRadiSam system radical SAM enzyme/AmmeMemoRadiSam system protein B/AmmeMemoRadiSam system protein A